jgi:hypothetical protein
MPVYTLSSLEPRKLNTLGTTRAKLNIRVKPLDVEMMKRLGTRVNLIPVIAKADTMTQEDLQNFKFIVSPPCNVLARLVLICLDPRGCGCAKHQDLQPAY